MGFDYMLAVRDEHRTNGFDYMLADRERRATYQWQRLYVG
jgi:hypothetical protein